MPNVPNHIPPDAVVAYDYFDQPGFRDAPHAVIASVFEGRSPRIIYTPLNGGHWVIGGYRELFDAARNTTVFSSTSMQIPAMEDEPRLIPLNTDPPEHDAYRSAFSGAFAPSRIMRMERDIRQLCDELIDKVVDSGQADFVSEISEPLPVFVFMRMAGIPDDRFRPFRDNVFTFLADPQPEKRTQALNFFHRELGELIEAKRAKPGDDLLSQLITAQIHDRPISNEELMGFCILLMFAGLDTVTNAMSLGVRHLASDHEMQERLRADPSLIPAAVEELLRRYVFANMGRILLDDIDFFGMPMKKGERVLFVPAGAGLDPEEFAHPQEVSLERKGKGIPTFGFGPHRCVGMHLARLELRILYEHWLKRIPTFSLSTDKPLSFHGGVVIGLENLPLEWSLA